MWDNQSNKQSNTGKENKDRKCKQRHFRSGGEFAKRLITAVINEIEGNQGNYLYNYN